MCNSNQLIKVLEYLIIIIIVRTMFKYNLIKAVVIYY